MVCNHLDCPLLLLTREVFCISPSQVLNSVSILHECIDSCTFKRVRFSKRVEREDIQTTETEFIHDWNNDTFCLNVYCMSN